MHRWGLQTGEFHCVVWPGWTSWLENPNIKIFRFFSPEMVRLSRESFCKLLLEGIGLAAVTLGEREPQHLYTSTHLIPLFASSLPSSAGPKTSPENKAPVFCQRCPALRAVWRADSEPVLFILSSVPYTHTCTHTLHSRFTWHHQPCTSGGDECKPGWIPAFPSAHWGPVFPGVPSSSHTWSCCLLSHFPYPWVSVPLKRAFISFCGVSGGSNSRSGISAWHLYQQSMSLSTYLLIASPPSLDYELHVGKNWYILFSPISSARRVSGTD